ncbi:hypothetical protein GH714_007383 [Hevea brasiliensis]|uniref:Integrase zinc-binding domain-containing protein n=1 Tax=Hevea brasiliensis TaxID=3981 RepID=A0A6A6NBY7_HEVBR|nr:hypothetical protein GH714_007383 [Hevea brasiliensis]
MVSLILGHGGRNSPSRFEKGTYYFGVGIGAEARNEIDGTQGLQLLAEGCLLLSTGRDFGKDVRNYIRHCPACQKNKYETIAIHGALQPLPLLQGLFTDITMDFI